VDYYDAARVYWERGWLAIPLGLDAQGYPKRPLSTGWPTLTPSWDVISALQWNEAHGIGIVLGSRSNNLCAIDIDDVTLADYVVQALALEDTPTRIVRTVRDRLHVYVYCRDGMDSHPLHLFWDNRDITVELKGTGTQVAAPPTPGYRCLDLSDPARYPSLRDAWVYISGLVGIATNVAESASYPAPWQPFVAKGQRNQSLYIEANKLREAGVPFAMALEWLEWRVTQQYEPGDWNWIECQKTIESAYRKDTPPQDSAWRSSYGTTAEHFGRWQR